MLSCESQSMQMSKWQPWNSWGWFAGHEWLVCTSEGRHEHKKPCNLNWFALKWRQAYRELGEAWWSGLGWWKPPEEDTVSRLKIVITNGWSSCPNATLERQQFPPKFRCLSTKLHESTFQITVNWGALKYFIFWHVSVVKDVACSV